MLDATNLHRLFDRFKQLNGETDIPVVVTEPFNEHDFGFVNDLINLEPLTPPSWTPASYAVATIPDGSLIAIAHEASPYVSIYQKSGDTLTRLSDPAERPNDLVNGISWAPYQYNYLACGFDSSPYLFVWKRVGLVFTKIANPAILPPDYVSSAEFSSGNTYLAAAHYGYPYLTIYKRVGDVLTKLANPSTLPTGTGKSVHWTNGTSEYLAVGHNNYPFLSIYRKVVAQDVFNKLDNPAILPPGSVNAVRFSPGNLFLAVGHSYAPYLTIYKKSGATFTKLESPDGPDVNPDFSGMSLTWDSSGDYLTVGHVGWPCLTTYKVVGDKFYRLPDLDPHPDDPVYGVTYIGTPSTHLLAVSAMSNEVTYLKAGNPLNTFRKSTSMVDMEDYDFTAVAYTDSAANSRDTANVSSIFRKGG